MLLKGAVKSSHGQGLGSLCLLYNYGEYMAEPRWWRVHVKALLVHLAVLVLQMWPFSLSIGKRKWIIIFMSLIMYDTSRHT